MNKEDCEVVVDSLLKYGANPFAKCYDAFGATTPIHIAVKGDRQNIPLVQVILLPYTSHCNLLCS